MMQCKIHYKMDFNEYFSYYILVHPTMHLSFEIKLMVIKKLQMIILVMFILKVLKNILLKFQ